MDEEFVENSKENLVEVSYDKVKSNVEAILFSYGDWISPTEIMNSLGLDSTTIVKNALSEISERFKEGFSFHVEENENGKWRMSLKEEFGEVVSDLISNVEIPPNVLKVLSVIAYEQPVTKTKLSEILGKSVKQEVAYLYRNKFLSYEKQGIGKYYRVTKKFYDYFKLEEGEDFRSTANKSIKVYLENPEQSVKNLDEENK